MSFNVDQEFLNFFRERFTSDTSDIDHKLYHFTSSYTAVKSLIENKRIWLSPHDSLNDPAEILYGIKLLSKKFIPNIDGDDLGNVYGEEEHFFDENIREIILTKNINFFIKTYSASLTESQEDSSNWRLYGNVGYGYCIEFDFSRVAESVYQVIYDVKTQNDILDSFLKKFQSHINENRNLIFAYLLQICSFFKHPSYRSEKEWRILGITSESSSLPPGRAYVFNQANGILKTYLSLDLLNIEISSIFCGAKQKESEIFAVKKSIAELNPKIKVFKSDVPIA